MKLKEPRIRSFPSTFTPPTASKQINKWRKRLLFAWYYWHFHSHQMQCRIGQQTYQIGNRNFRNGLPHFPPHPNVMIYADCRVLVWCSHWASSLTYQLCLPSFGKINSWSKSGAKNTISGLSILSPRDRLQFKALQITWKFVNLDRFNGQKWTQFEVRK